MKNLRHFLPVFLFALLPAPDSHAGLIDKIKNYFSSNSVQDATANQPKKNTVRTQNSGSSSANENRKDLPTKVKLPSGIKFGMTSDQVLAIKPCKLQKTEGLPLKSNALKLGCLSAVAPPFPYESPNSSFLNPIIASFSFVNDRLRRVEFLMGGLGEFVPLINGGKVILGPLLVGADAETLRKFDAGIVDNVLIGWADGSQNVLIQILNIPSGEKLTSLIITAYDFDSAEEFDQ